MLQGATRACQIDLYAQSRREDGGAVATRGECLRELQRSCHREIEVGAKVTRDPENHERIEGDGSRETACLPGNSSDAVAGEDVIEPFWRASDCKCSCCTVIRSRHLFLISEDISVRACIYRMFLRREDCQIVTLT